MKIVTSLFVVGALLSGCVTNTPAASQSDHSGYYHQSSGTTTVVVPQRSGHHHALCPRQDQAALLLTFAVSRRAPLPPDAMPQHVFPPGQLTPQDLRQRWRNLPHVDDPESPAACEAGSGNEQRRIHFGIFR